MFPKIISALAILVEAVMSLKDMYDRNRERRLRTLRSRLDFLAADLLVASDPKVRRDLHELQLRLTQEYQRLLPHSSIEGDR
jgi:hypothetical protein